MNGFFSKGIVPLLFVALASISYPFYVGAQIVESHAPNFPDVGGPPDHQIKAKVVLWVILGVILFALIVLRVLEKRDHDK